MDTGVPVTATSAVDGQAPSWAMNRIPVRTSCCVHRASSFLPIPRVAIAGTLPVRAVPRRQARSRP